MKFYEYKTLWDLARCGGDIPHNVSADAFYDKVQEVAGDNLNNAHSLRLPHKERGDRSLTRLSSMKMDIISSRIEQAWIQDVRPYYKVWPAIMDALLRIKLDIPSEVVALPLRCVCIRLPEINGSPTGPIRTILCGVVHPAGEAPSTWILTDGDEEAFITPSGIRIPGLRTVDFAQAPGKTFEECLVGARTTSEAYEWNAIRLVCGISLLSVDPSIISPDVLDRDKERARGASAELLERLINRARQRGKVGWCIGEQYEVIPHWRRPHLALVWTEKGRRVPKIVMRKGSIVHRQKMTTVPTGHIEDDGTEHES